MLRNATGQQHGAQRFCLEHELDQGRIRLGRLLAFDDQLRAQSRPGEAGGTERFTPSRAADRGFIDGAAARPGQHPSATNG